MCIGEKLEPKTHSMVGTVEPVGGGIQPHYNTEGDVLSRNGTSAYKAKKTNQKEE